MDFLQAATYGLGLLEAGVIYLKTDNHIRKKRGHKIAKELEDMDLSNYEPDPKKKAIVISGAILPKDGECSIERRKKRTELLGRLMRINGYEVTPVDGSKDRGEYLTELLKGYEQNPERLLIYFEGHGNNTQTTDLPVPSKLIQLLGDIEGTESELLVNSCASGIYTDEARETGAKNLKVYSTTKRNRYSSGANLVYCMIKNARKKDWKFETAGELVPKNYLTPKYILKKFCLNARKLFSRNPENKYASTGRVQIYNPTT